MSQRTPIEQLGPVLEALMDEPDPQERERLLVRAVHGTGLAEAVGIYAEGRPWMRLAGCGATAGLPGADQVEGVASGVLDGELPLGGLVVVGGRAPRRRALAILRHTASAPDANRDGEADLLESLLMVLACLDTEGDGGRGHEAEVEADLADRVLPPFQRRDRRDRSSFARVAPGLRELLRTIRERQDELERGPAASEDDWNDLLESVEQECQAAADLLLDAFTSPGEAPPAPLDPNGGPKNRWLRLFEERVARHARRLDAGGRSLVLSGIDPGARDVDVSTEVFHGVVDGLISLAEHHLVPEGEPASEIHLSLEPAHGGSGQETLLGLQLAAEVASSALPRRRAEPPELRELRRRVREAEGRLRTEGNARVVVWIPFL